MPILLRRAKRLINKSFMDIVRDMASERRVAGGVAQRIRGVALPEEVAVATSGQKFIARNRAPRVQIEYDVELYGAQKKIQLPFVMGVMADLSGKPAEALPGIKDRKFLEIDAGNVRRPPEGDEAPRRVRGAQHADR